MDISAPADANAREGAIFEISSFRYYWIKIDKIFTIRFFLTYLFIPGVRF